MIDTITFFAVSCPENPAFFRKNWQIFENIPRKMLYILNILEKCCILEKSRKKLVKFGENSAKFSQNLRNFGEKTAKNSAIFNEHFEIRERSKGMHCADLGESFPTCIYLQNLASIPKHFLKLAASASQPARQGKSSVFSNFFEPQSSIFKFPNSQIPNCIPTLSHS